MFSGLQRAETDLQEALATATEYQRLVVYSHLPSNRLLAPPAACGEWVAIWSDYPNAARELAIGTSVQVIRADSRSVTISRRNWGPINQASPHVDNKAFFNTIIESCQNLTGYAVNRPLAESQHCLAASI